ncbi:brain-specific angiogenesis inhibitor 1-associated protein 2-like protein 1 [Protopterus annectens]|uniref:brain-specific angiogenesis inhibitor 1-associated protein 2-like protein 1 n=1 Tax=Protopterus annectens TaxID=7888 RepID=UPI001CFC3050|nr:brain-specific angiogenesis inhibitor 1-associated protein 2-like protein 1 [Protopterus annectens]
MNSTNVEEVNRLTESTYKNVMEQFNPGLRNLVTLGRNYEKAVTAMVLAGKAYYDAVAKIGELALASLVSKELGFVLIEISDAHKRLNHDLDESFKKFHKEIVAELERKTDLDVKYMTATLKKYQIEHRSKLDSLEKSQTELKKLRRKSQGSKNATKYENKEHEYLESINSRQTDIQKFIAEGCKEALLEEKRRFCFLVDKHCNFSSHMSGYHEKAKDFLTSKLCNWQEMCGDATKVPETITTMIEKVKTPSSTPLSVTPQPSPVVDRRVSNTSDSILPSRPPPAPSSRATISPLVHMFTVPPESQKRAENTQNSLPHNQSFGKLQNSVSVATGLNMMGQSKVKTIFPHTAGNNKTLMSFDEGDIITLLIPEEKDGWLYGEHDNTKVRGWFPSSYCKQFLQKEHDQNNRQSLVSPRSVSTLNLSDNNGVYLPPPDYLDSSLDSEATTDSMDEGMYPSRSAAHGPLPPKPNNAAAAVPQVNGIMKPPFLGGSNPFASVKLRPTVTNDRSAPMI